MVMGLPGVLLVPQKLGEGKHDLLLTPKVLVVYCQQEQHDQNLFSLNLRS